VANNVDSWRNASLAVRLRLFPCLSPNIHAILQLIEGLNPCAEAAVALEL
jgi:hypothetical protein